MNEKMKAYLGIKSPAAPAPAPAPAPEVVAETQVTPDPDAVNTPAEDNPEPPIIDETWEPAPKKKSKRKSK